MLSYTKDDFYDTNSQDYFQYGNGNNIINQYDDKYSYKDIDKSYSGKAMYNQKATQVPLTNPEEEWSTLAKNYDGYTVEVLIVADRTMQKQNIRHDDLNHYILTLMSHVSILLKLCTGWTNFKFSLIHPGNYKQIETLFLSHHTYFWLTLQPQIT